jgi:hypothetical protein
MPHSPSQPEPISSTLWPQAANANTVPLEVAIVLGLMLLAIIAPAVYSVVRMTAS